MSGVSGDMRSNRNTNVIKGRSSNSNQGNDQRSSMLGNSGGMIDGRGTMESEVAVVIAAPKVEDCLVSRVNRA